MAFNIAQVGVDRKSGSPIIQRSNTFTYNNDPNGTADLFHFFGTKLKSSPFINPDTTEFLEATRIEAGLLTTSAANVVDNNPTTTLFTNSTTANDGVRIAFTQGNFVLTSIQINSNSATWTVEGSNNGTAWTNIALGGNQNLGNSWLLHTVPNTTAYNYYRVLHGQSGISKNLNAIKFFGTYSNTNLSFNAEEEATIIATHGDNGIIYIPNANELGVIANFYTVIYHVGSGEYTFSQFNGSVETLTDNTNGKLLPGEQLTVRYTGTEWELFKVGAGVDLGTKGALLTHNGTDAQVLPVGSNNQFLRVNSSQPEGLQWETIDLNDINSPTTSFNFGGQRLTNLATPVSPTDGVNKAYADSTLLGIDPKNNCEVATTTDLDTETGLTWTSAGSKVGKTLTSNGSTAIIDGETLVNGYRVLVKDQAIASDNGIYTVSGVGSTVTLTRSPDFDEDVEVTPGAFTFITGGSANLSTGYLLLGTGSISVDTTNLDFSKFVGAGSLNFNSLNDVNVGIPNASNDQQLIGWDNTSGQFQFTIKPGTAIGDLAVLEDVNSNPGLPAVDGTQLILNSTQVSPLTTAGDLWVYNTISNTRQPIGTNHQILTVDISEATRLKYKTLSSNDLTVIPTATDLTFNFTTGVNTVILGPLVIDDTLTPNDNEFLRYDAATSRFIAEDPTGTAIDDLVVLEDVGGNPGLPAVDGSQLTNVVVDTGQGSPLTTKGDIYIYSADNDRLPVGSDFTVLTADSTAPEGLSYKPIAEAGRVYKDAVNDGGIPRTYVSDGDTNGILYFTGTQEGTQAWTNPHTAGFITLTTNNQGTPSTGTDSQVLVDRSFVGGASFSASGSNVVIDTKKENYVTLEKLSFRIGNSLGALGLSGNFIVRGANTFNDALNGTGNAETFINVAPSTLGWAINTWFNYDFTPIGSYQYIYITWGTQLILSELELYGQANVAPLSYNLVAGDEDGTIVIPVVNEAAIILPTGLPTGFSTFIQNRDTTTTRLISDGLSTVIGDSVIYNQGDLLKLTNIGSDTWISSNLSSIQLANKGELLGFTTKPNILAPGSNGQILTANTSSDIGFRWEDRAGADDLIYSKEIPVVILNSTAADIFKSLTPPTYTYPASNGVVTATTNTTNANNNPIFLLNNSLAAPFSLNAGQFVAFEFLTLTLQPYQLAIYEGQNNTSDIDVVIQVSNDGSSWNQVASYTFVANQVNIWNIIPLNTNGYYKYIRLVNNSSVTLDMAEWKLFGWVKNNPQVGEIFAVSATGITPIEPGPDNYALVTDSAEATGVKWVQLDASLITSAAHLKIPTSETTASSTVTLLINDANVQVIDPNGATREVILPDPPEQDLYFKIINTDAANFSINIKETAAGPVIKTLDIDTPYVECHRTQNNWLILD